MTSRPVVAIVPFGAKGRDAKAGGIGRQVARRLVERFADDPNVELRPVFLVAMPIRRATPDIWCSARRPIPTSPHGTASRSARRTPSPDFIAKMRLAVHSR